MHLNFSINLGRNSQMSAKFTSFWEVFGFSLFGPGNFGLFGVPFTRVRAKKEVEYKTFGKYLRFPGIPEIFGETCGGK